MEPALRKQRSVSRFLRRLMIGEKVPQVIQPLPNTALPTALPVAPPATLSAGPLAELPPLPFDGNGSLSTANSSHDPDSSVVQPATTTSTTPTSKPQTTSFLDLPGEIRNYIYTYCFSTSLASDSPPHTHIFPSALPLLQTCHQIQGEARHYLGENALIHGLHATQPMFYYGLSADLLEKMKVIYLPASEISDASLEYDKWRKGTYSPILQNLCSRKFHPTTLIFSADCRIGGFESRVTDSRCARYANNLLDLRHALTLMSTVERVHVVDNVSSPYTLATRDYFAELFERCFPTDGEMVGRMQYDLLSDPGSLTYYYYGGTMRYREIPRAQSQWGLQRSSENVASETGVDLVLEAACGNDGSKRVVEVYVFSNWGEFSKAYRGPFASPVRDPLSISHEEA
jgi:hypothetical protein